MSSACDGETKSSRVMECFGRNGVRSHLVWIGCLLSGVIVIGCSSEERKLSDANELFLGAQKSIAAGDKDKALEQLNDSIAAGPTIWAYKERARLLAEKGEEGGAKADCESGLAIAPEDADLLWIKGELAKPRDQRFKGKLKDPPSKNR